MKKLVFILFLTAILASCDCALSQMPPQYLYAGENCTASLPDYKPMVTVTGGCFGFTLTQAPLPGTILSVTNQQVNVVIKATGNNNKSSYISFPVTLLDTITPKITINTTALEQSTIKQANALYDAGDKIIKKLTTAPFPWDSLGIIEPIDIEDKMLIAISMDSAGTGIRKRVFTFADVIQLGDDTANVGKLKWEQIINKPSEYIPMAHGHGLNQLDLTGFEGGVMPDSISWTKIYGLDNLDRVPYLLDYRDLYDWLAYVNYATVPARSITTAPINETRPDHPYAPMVFDPNTLRLKYWNGSAWKIIATTN